MPYGRMIQRKALDDERLNSLSVEAEFLFYKFIIACDREGRLQGSPRYINKTFYGLRDYDDRQIEGWLHELANCKKNGKGLIELYEVEGRRYLWLPGFLHEQSKSWLKWVKPKEAESNLPAPPNYKEEKIESEKKAEQASKPPAPSKSKPKSAPQPKQPQLGAVPTTEISSELAECVRAYEESLGKIATPMDAEKIKDLVEHYGEAKFKSACDKAKKANAHSINYVVAVIEGKERDGADKQNPRQVPKHTDYVSPEDYIKQRAG